MAHTKEFIQDQVNRGIASYKADDQVNARLYFQAALRRDPENIVLLLWLAYLATTFEKRVFILERVLELDPDNKRAKAGLKWAKKQEQSASTGQETGQSAQDLPEIFSFSRKFGTDDLREKAMKGAIAQRARRRIAREIG